MRVARLLQPGERSSRATGPSSVLWPVPADPRSADWKQTQTFALMFRDVANALVRADPAGVVVDG